MINIVLDYISDITNKGQQRLSTGTSVTESASFEGQLVTVNKVILKGREQRKHRSTST
jgi:hypothetical protein